MELTTLQLTTLVFERLSIVIKQFYIVFKNFSILFKKTSMVFKHFSILFKHFLPFIICVDLNVLLLHQYYLYLVYQLFASFSFSASEMKTQV